MSTLMRAINGNNKEQVQKLIDQGVDVNQLEANGDAPLIMAAYKGYSEIVEMLLKAGADVTAVDPGMKATALHAAAYAGRTEAARLLIEYGIDVDAQGPYNGYTALHDAIWQNNVQTAAMIIDAGPDLSIENHEGQTALVMAQARGRGEIVELITGN